MASRVFLSCTLLACASGFQHNLLRTGRGARGVASSPETEIPTAGEAVGDQVGVDVPNPHAYVGALVGGGVAGSLIAIAVFCIASYYCYKWNKEMTEKKENPKCGILSVACCLCCTPVVCCFPVDKKAE